MLYIAIHSAWLLADPKGSPYHYRNGFSVAFMSPNYERYKEYLKMPGATTRYMAPWSCDELELCGQRIHKLQLSEIRKLYSFWGGSPRYVLQHASDASQQSKLSSDVLKELTPTQLQTLFHAKGVIPASMGAIGGNLVQMVPDAVHNCTFAFVSDHVAQELFVYHRQTMQSLLRFYERTMLDYGDKRYATTTGGVYEQMVHAQIRAGGKFKYAVLMKASTTVASVEPSSLLKLPAAGSINYFANLKQMMKQTICCDVYYKPDNRNFAAVDAFMVVGTTLHMFQMTTNLEHKAGANGVLKVMQKVATDCKIDTYNLIFIVPSREYQTFGFQTWKGEHRLNKAIEQCQQWKVALDPKV